jgi:hypothetical protein
MRRVFMVRYKVKPDQAANNEQLIRAVFEELQITQPDGIRYSTFRLDDGVTFVNLVVTETEAASARWVSSRPIDRYKRGSSIGSTEERLSSANCTRLVTTVSSLTRSGLSLYSTCQLG